MVCEDAKKKEAAMIRVIVGFALVLWFDGIRIEEIKDKRK